MSAPTTIDLTEIEARLRARRDELRRSAAATADDRRPVEVDPTTQGRLSRMDALQLQAMALETERRRNVELARIEAALQRIADGEYGCCVSCGEPIAPKRLELDPAVPTCIDCAAGATGRR
jgi:DnaK suppressor protein